MPMQYTIVAGDGPENWHAQAEFSPADHSTGFHEAAAAAAAAAAVPYSHDGSYMCLFCSSSSTRRNKEET